MFRGCAWSLLLSWVVAAPAFSADPCTSLPVPGQRAVRVARVLDGDTLLLRGGERLRLIGLDAPELGRDGRPSAAGAERARARLARLAAPGSVLYPQLGREPRDRHGRLLAHLFSADGTNLGVRLLDEGLAVPLPFPPNLAFIECYRRAVAGARATRRGLWALPAYRRRDAGTLSVRARGYHRLYGRVHSVVESRRGLWIRLEGSLSLHVPRVHLQYFGELLERYRELPGTRIEVAGWLGGRGRYARMLLRHPSQLRWGAASGREARHD